MALVSKASVGKTTGGSNPSPSAKSHLSPFRVAFKFSLSAGWVFFLPAMILENMVDFVYVHSLRPCP